MALQQIFSTNRARVRGKLNTTNDNSANQMEAVNGEEEKDTECGGMNRCGSFHSTSSVSGDICRICHSGVELGAELEGSALLTPCHCLGSMRYVHQKCLQRWIKSSQVKNCELCRYEFQMQSKTKPFNKWEKLEMSAVERRKVLCSVAFHVIAITCVVWSLYVLIEKTTEEIAANQLEWPFWTKLIVVAVGFTGGCVFMYVQCKMYIQLCRRWKTYNRVIYIQSCSSYHPPTSSLGASQNWSEIYQYITFPPPNHNQPPLEQNASDANPASSQNSLYQVVHYHRHPPNDAPLHEPDTSSRKWGHDGEEDCDGVSQDSFKSCGSEMPPEAQHLIQQHHQHAETIIQLRDDE